MWSEIRKAGHWEVAVTLGLIRWLSQFNDSVCFAWWNNHLPKKKNPFISFCAYGMCECTMAMQGSEDNLQESLLSSHRVGPGHRTCIFVHGDNHFWLLSLLSWPRIWLFGCCCSGIYFLFVSLPPIYTWLIFGWVLCVIMGAGSTAQPSETRGQLWELVLPPTLSEAGFLCKLDVDSWTSGDSPLFTSHLSLGLFALQTCKILYLALLGFWRSNLRSSFYIVSALSIKPYF